MDLSIIIVNFNTGELLYNCVKSIIFSLNNPSVTFEIIIVDNKSSDNSLDITEQLKIENKNIKISNINNKENSGFSKATNLGIKFAKGEYILLLNPDTIIFPNTFEALFEFMKKYEAAGALSCKLELQNGKLDQACHRGFPTVWNSFTFFSGLEKIFQKVKIFSGYSLTYKNMNKIHEIDSGCGAFLLVRRSAGESINWLDEDFFWYGEDIDFCFRLKKAGWKIFFIPNVKVIHYKGASSGIKKHSKNFSVLNKSEKLKVIKSSTEVMRIFFNKHYKNKYPRLFFNLTIFAIYILEKIRILKFKLFS